jgi:hypothetical protein
MFAPELVIVRPRAEPQNLTPLEIALAFLQVSL